MIKKATRSRFFSLSRIIFSALLLAFALGTSACSGSSSAAATGSTITGSAQ